MAGAIQTRIVGAKDPRLALVECGRDAGLEDTRVWHAALLRPPAHHSPWSANFLVGGILVGQAPE